MTTMPASSPLSYGSARPRVATPPASGDTRYVELILGVHALAGHPAMPWQEHLHDATARVDAAGAWATPDVGVIVARQNGKTDAVTARLITGARFLRDRCLYTTASGAAAVDTWRRVDTWVDSVPLLRRKVADIKRSNGRERLAFRGGGVIQIATTGGRPPRGFDKVALLVYDEARELRTWAPVAALDPTQAAAGSRAQRLIVSNAGDDRSVVLNAARDAGRDAAEHQEPGPCWLEWSARPGGARDELAAIAAANPALGHTLELGWLLRKARELPEAEYRTEHLCQWVSLLEAVVDLDVWDALEDPDGPLPAVGGLALAFDVALDRSDAAVCAAWRDPSGRAWVQCVDHRPGTDWLAPRLLELLARWRAPVLAFDAAGPALDVADELARALAADPPGLAPVELTGLSGRDYAAACASMLAHITDRRLSHAHAAPVRASLSAAGTRPLGDAWAWARRSSTASLAALVAATCALWGHDHTQAPRRPVVAAAPR
jgi:hypothetical protein